MPETSLSQTLIADAHNFCNKVDALEFSGATFVYNPLRYARAANDKFLDLYGNTKHVALLLGMNPGPWGMAQTGIPFGEVVFAKEWLGIDVPIEKPEREHPSRPILGSACTRREVSGLRLWTWAQARFLTPENFFSHFFVANYCPLAFLAESGANITPNQLPPPEQEKLYTVCDSALRTLVWRIAPTMVVGVGAFAEKRARKALGKNHPIGRILHPSPRSPAANRGWVKQAEQQLKQLGIIQ